MRRSLAGIALVFLLAVQAQAQDTQHTAALPFVTTPSNFTSLALPWDFEQGWDGNRFYRTGPMAHGGNAYLEFGGFAGTVHGVDQVVTVPAGTSSIGYWVWIQSTDPDCTLNDLGGVYVIKQSIITQADQFALCTATNTGGWVKRVANLSAFAGQTVTISISADSYVNLSQSLLRLDDVGWQ